MEKVKFSEALTFLNVIGMHPSKTNLFAKVRLFLSFAVFLSVMISSTLEALFRSKGLNTYARYSEAIIPQVQLFCKMAILAIRRQEVSQLLKDANKFWSFNKFGPNYEEKFYKLHAYLKTFFFVYKILIIFTCCQFLFVKIVFKKKEPMVLSFGESRGLEPVTDHFYLFLHAAITFVSINIINGFDGLFFYTLGHILTEFKMIKTAFGNYAISTKWSDAKRFKKTAIHHKDILNYVERFSNIVSSVLLVQHMSCLLGICFALFLVSKDGMPPDVDRLIKYLPYIISFTLQTLTFCFAGHLLIDWSLEVPEEIFYNGWNKTFGYKNKLGKLLAIQRSQRAARLKLGGFGDLDLESFKLVMQKSFSFFAFINTMNSKK